MYLPLHKLWQDYMKNMLNLQANRYVTKKCRSVCMIMNQRYTQIYGLTVFTCGSHHSILCYIISSCIILNLSDYQRLQSRKLEVGKLGFTSQ